MSHFYNPIIFISNTFATTKNIIKILWKNL